MEENYIEWLVKRKDPVYAWPLKILMILVCAVSVLAALQIMFGILILAAAAVATYFVFLNLNVEYEYLFADGGFSVDSILGKAKRKKIRLRKRLNKFKKEAVKGLKAYDLKSVSHITGTRFYWVLVAI